MSVSVFLKLVAIDVTVTRRLRWHRSRILPPITININVIWRLQEQEFNLLQNIQETTAMTKCAS